MVKTSQARQKRLDDVFHALADPTRRALLTRLRRGNASVGELAAAFPISLPAVSKHLRVLEEAGLVTKSQAGRALSCALAPAALREADRWLDAYRVFWSDTLDALAHHVGNDDL